MTREDLNKLEAAGLVIIDKDIVDAIKDLVKFLSQDVVLQDIAASCDPTTCAGLAASLAQMKAVVADHCREMRGSA